VAQRRHQVIARNILFNALGGAWVLIISIMAVPLQIRLLGIESYGVIGFLASLQAIMAILDLGLPTMIIRLVAGKGRAAEAAVRSASGLYAVVGTAAGLALITLSPLLCDAFLAPSAAMRSAIIDAMRITGIAFAIRWPVAVYAGMLAGMQRMDLTNLLKAGGTTLRSLGVCGALWLLPDIRVFAAWMALAGALELAAYMWACRRAWPGCRLLPGFGLAPLAGTWAFSAGMVAISAESIALTQADRLVVARGCGLLEFGHYSAACSFAFALALLQGFITSALLPVLSTSADRERGSERREAATELLMLVMSAPALALAVMGGGLLRLILPDADATAISVPLAGLALGALVNSALSLAVTDAIATGRIGGVLLLNLISLPLYLTVLIIGVRMYGGAGAAAAWLLLNLSYLVSVPFALDRGDDHPHSIRLILRCAVPFWLSAAIWMVSARLLLPPTPLWSLAAFLAGSLLHLACGWLILTARTRELARRLIRGYLPAKAG
jgi:O-antigen/teichoic acid export membrane protein